MRSLRVVKQELAPKTKRARLFNHMKRAAPAVKNYLVDSFAGVTFFTPINAFNELVIADMPVQTCIKSRLMGTCIGLIVNRPYGKFREIWVKLWKTTPDSSKLRKFLVDTSALTVFSMPLFIGMYYTAGATLKEGLIAIGAALATNTITGRAYGWYLDKFRKYFGTKPTLEKSD